MTVPRDAARGRPVTSPGSPSAESPLVRPCPGCGHDGVASVHVLRNLLFPGDERYRYLECGGCHSLRIETIPVDLARHYPDDYYSQHVPDEDSRAKKLVLRALAYGWERDGTAAGRVARRIRPDRIPPWASSLRRSASIVDVGSGGGETLRTLAQVGFRDLLGVDPYLHEEVVRSDFTLKRCELADLGGPFDVIMFHHSLEHVTDPGATLEVARRRLSPGGQVLIRVPIFGQAAWREYGHDWIQLDPPRHLTLFSEQGLRTAIETAGLQVDRLDYDSWSMQFWGSELARRGRPVMGIDPRAEFSPAELEAFDQRAEQLNREHDGDQVLVLASRADQETRPRG